MPEADLFAPEEEDEIPDLRGVPMDEYKDVLRPYRPYVRRAAISRYANYGMTHEERVALAMAQVELEGEDIARRRVKLPDTPHGARVDGRPRRQVNVRLQVEDHERLGTAAKKYGLTPTQLARLLIVRGVDLALRDDVQAAR